MNALKTVWKWVVYSSDNASNFSLTLKGILASIVTFSLFAIGFFHLNVTNAEVTNVTDGILVAFNATMTLLSWIVTAVSAWAVAWGAFRKLFTTLVGANAVLND